VEPWRGWCYRDRRLSRGGRVEVRGQGPLEL